VHIGTDDMPYEIARKLLGKKKIIGLTAHNVEEAKEAERLGADYIGVSPIFATGTKPDAGRPAGLSLVKDAKKAVRIPIVAIGGITLDNAPEVVTAGADALCAISAVVTKEDMKSEIVRFQKLFSNFP
jgi:thiamine-phosphate pyrophosphorylase